MREMKCRITGTLCRVRLLRGRYRGFVWFGDVESVELCEGEEACGSR